MGLGRRLSPRPGIRFEFSKDLRQHAGRGLEFRQFPQLLPGRLQARDFSPQRRIGIHRGTRLRVYGFAVANAQQVFSAGVHDSPPSSALSPSSRVRNRLCARASCDLEKLVVRPIIAPISLWV